MSSPLYDAMLADIKEAMKAKNADALTALRTVNAQIKDATVNQSKEVTDDVVAAVLAKAIKQRQDAVDQFRQGGRADLADKEQKEIGLLKKYQPQQLSAAEIEALVRACVAETGAAGKKDMGKLMGTLMPQVKGKADGRLVNQIVMRILGP